VSDISEEMARNKDYRAERNYADLNSSEDEDEEDCFITFTTSEGRCDKLFDRGIDMVAQGDPVAALSTFLDTLTALQECHYSNKLLPTLYHIAEAYRVLGEADKSREISDTISLMQEALEDAMKEKWKKSKKLGRIGALSDQGDCGSLFLQKADTCESLARDFEENGDLERALELAEHEFRIRQYTLGPQNPTTVRSLRNLTASYKRAGKAPHFTHNSEPIIFTSVIKSSCPQSCTPTTCVETSTPSSYFEATSSSKVSTPPSESEEASTLPSISEAPKLSSLTETPPVEPSVYQEEEILPFLIGNTNNSPRCLPPSTLVSPQDVLMDTSSDKDISGPQCGSETFSYSFPPPISDSANLASFCTLLLVFSVTAMTALSISFYVL
jgi:hypothetical protein